MRTRILTAAVVAAVATASLAGCTASGGSTASSAGGGSAAGSSASKPMTAEADAKAVDRSVVTTGTLRLAADDPVAVAGRITGLVDAAGGHVDRSSEDPAERPTADLVVRIPAAAFPRTLAAIEREGDVRDVSVRATDVTAQVTDYAVRIANLRTSIDRLRTLLARATSSSDLVQIESTLTDRQGSLEQLLAQQRSLADEVDLATLTISIVVPVAAPRTGPADFVGGLVTGTQALVQAAAATAVGLGLVLPWAATLGLLGALVLAVVRVVRRRTRPTSA
ncbi:DUF4349 domain-containing protein [Amnibacterium kyonggiense]|uniref:Uncharacterized protein DUF4349 n=1 Tax=Amnibacterium kyonggiense TaxID=595671 RepID=A0A4R7FS83_9MICO|nr:DUF4349 domain-containing protein [Amnibacterium kyonggiense]TDS80529.1 uncharacterized protein DUF4349 [Amnibacterium kyonggiense]